MKNVFWVIVALAVFGGIIGSCSHHGSNSSASSDSSGSGSHVYLVASQSFCVPTGIDDAYTGDGHVTFFLTFHNSGHDSGTASAVPVRHYDDGGLNDSPMDMVDVTIPAGATEKYHTDAMTYKAHEHEVVSCGVEVDGRSETSIDVR